MTIVILLLIIIAATLIAGPPGGVVALLVIAGLLLAPALLGVGAFTVHAAGLGDLLLWLPAAFLAILVLLWLLARGLDALAKRQSGRQRAPQKAPNPAPAPTLPDLEALLSRPGPLDGTDRAAMAEAMRAARRRSAALRHEPGRQAAADAAAAERTADRIAARLAQPD